MMELPMAKDLWRIEWDECAKQLCGLARQEGPGELLIVTQPQQMAP
jgi:hypothetical protein